MSVHKYVRFIVVLLSVSLIAAGCAGAKADSGAPTDSGATVAPIQDSGEVVA